MYLSATLYLHLSRHLILENQDQHGTKSNSLVIRVWF